MSIKLDEIKAYSRYYQTMDNRLREIGYDDLTICSKMAEDMLQKNAKKLNRHK